MNTICIVGWKKLFVLGELENFKPRPKINSGCAPVTPNFRDSLKIFSLLKPLFDLSVDTHHTNYNNQM